MIGANTSLRMTIGLISATKEESKNVCGSLKKNKSGNFYTGKIGKNKVVHAVSGIGKTNASHSATLLIERFSPSLIINFGIGGAYPSSGLGAGDIAVADKEIYGDEGLWLIDGFHTADSIGIPFLYRGGKKYFNEFPFDKKLAGKAMEICKRQFPPPLSRESGRSVIIKSGTFVTVSAATGTDKRAKELEKRFGAICENMEGAAVAHICAIYGIPLLEIRGISNIIEDRDRKKWDIKSAVENCQTIIINFLKSSRIK